MTFYIYYPNRTGRHNKTKVYVNRWSISAEWVSGNGIEDMENAYAFELLTFEYSGEKYAEYNGKPYRITNVSIRGDRTVLTMEYDA